MPYTITLELNPSSTDIQVLGDGIIEYAREVTQHRPMEFFACFIRDNHNKILGGCNGSTLYGCLYVDQLWVSQTLRTQGYGRQLIEKALEFGIAKGCSFAAVNTMDWEALEFYQKLGFEIEFQRTGFDHHSTFYFLRKSLVVRGTSVIQENTASPWSRNAILSSIVQELKKIHHCHTIVLYGSRARGDDTATSDYDIAGFTNTIHEKQWLARFDETHQVFLDIFIYPTQELMAPNESHLQMSDGIVLIEQNEFGTHLLEKLKKLTHQPLALSKTERQGRIVWYQKMLSRAKIGDIEGRYRQLWMIQTLLEDYFAFKNLRFMGPKKAFQYLKEHDSNAFALFEATLNNPDDTQLIEQLSKVVLQQCD